jgi:Uma2 family endonuclease
VEAADYSREHPSAAILVIEVATSSLRQDRRIKAALYARAKIPEFWLIDVKARSVEVYRNPLNTGCSLADAILTADESVLRTLRRQDLELLLS